MAETPRKKTPRDLLRVIFRRWQVFLICATIFAVAVMIGAHFVPVKYTGSTKFGRRSDPAAPEERGNVETFSSQKEMLHYELGGYNAVAQAADDLELTRGMPHGPDGQLTEDGQRQKRALVEKLMRGIGISWDVRTDRVDLISVSFTDQNQDRCEKMPNCLVKNYVNRVSEQIVQRLTASRDFLVKQVTDSNALLDQVNAKRIVFETKHAGAMPGDPGALQQRIQDIISQIDSLRRQNELAKMRLEALKAATRPPTSQPSSQPAMPTSQPVQVVMGPNPELRRLLNELYAHEEQLTNEKVFKKDLHPSIQTLKVKIEQLKKRIKETPEQVQMEVTYRIGDPIELTIAQQEVETTARDLERLTAQLAGYENIMKNYGPIQQEYLNLTKQYDGQQAEVKRWAGRLEEVQMALQAEVAKKRTHLETMQVATRPDFPSYPVLWKVLSVAIVGGLGFAGGLVFLSNMMDRSITTPEDAKQFGVPIQGVIGEIVTARQRRMRKLRRWIITPIVSVIILVTVGFSALSIRFWLQDPDNRYKKLHNTPAKYIQDEIISPVASLFDRL